MRGRWDAPDEELQEFNASRMTSPSPRGSQSSEVVRASTRGVAATGPGLRRGGGGVTPATETSIAAATINWEWTDDEGEFSPQAPSTPMANQPIPPSTLATPGNRVPASFSVPTPSSQSHRGVPSTTQDATSQGNGWGHEEDGDGWGDAWGDDDGWNESGAAEANARRPP
ncbi:hypothetical protein AB1Y20_015311 [Prymnesium parvum]|uniref:Uncharacterized protein n=1 Tax=Prymnesium parvum TaxID=97485 RepID=A0AB34K146_PRYPA